jgi:hypothetical protein
VATLVSTVLDVCGAGWLIALCLAAVFNLGVAIRLSFFTRSVVALVAFFPIATLPLWIGIFGSLLSLTQVIELGLDREMASEAVNMNVLIAMALLPTVVGATLSIPAYATAAYGRFWLATKTMPTSRASAVGEKGALAADEQAYQQYADSLAGSGHRRIR